MESKDDINNLKADTITALFWKLLERGGNAIIQLIVQIVMARLLLPDDFGALAIMLVFINLGNVIVQSGLNTALIQKETVEASDFSTVFWMSIAISIVLYSVIFMAAPVIAAFYSMKDLIWPLRVLSIVLLVNAFNSIQVAKITREFKMKLLFKATLCSVVVSGAVGIASALLGAGLWALVLQQISYQIVNCIVLHLQMSWFPRFEFSFDRARELFSFGSRLLASGLISTLYQSLGNLIIGKQFSASKLGLVSQGEKYPMAIGNMLDGAIQPVMLSAVAKVQHDKTKVKHLVRRALKTSTYVIIPSMVCFACCAPVLIPSLLGPQWTASIPYMQIYCLVYALFPIHTTNLQALNGMGRSDLFLKLEVIKKSYGLAVMLFCAFVLKDVNMLVLSYLLTGVIGTFVNAWPNRKVICYKYSEQIADIAPSAAIAAIAAAPVYSLGFIGLPALITLCLQVGVYLVLYLGVSYLIKLDSLIYILNSLGSSRGRKG